MIVGSGVDILEVERMRKSMGRWGDRLLKRVFTDREIAYSKKKRDSAQHFAARFCAKEALVKAAGGGWEKEMRWTDVEILNDRNGSPQVRAYGPARRLLLKVKVDKVMVSMSHTRDYAVASAILERR